MESSLEAKNAETFVSRTIAFFRDRSNITQQEYPPVPPVAETNFKLPFSYQAQPSPAQLCSVYLNVGFCVSK